MPGWVFDGSACGKIPDAPVGSRAVRSNPVDRGGVETAAALRGDSRSGVEGVE